MADLLSIVIPVHDAGKYLKPCLESVLEQSYEPFEVLLIDDASTDGSSELCDSYAKKDDRVRTFHIDHSGPGGARNFGIENIRGKYLAFVDSDDIVTKDMYSIMIHTMKKDGTKVCVCGWSEINENDGSSCPGLLTKFGVIPFSEMLRNMILESRSGGAGYPWNKVFDYEAIKDHNGNDMLFNTDIYVYEDSLWLDGIYYSMIDTGASASIIADELYRYLIRTDSFSHDFTLEKRMNRLEALRRINQFTDKLSDVDRKRAQAGFASEVFWELWNLRDHRNSDIRDDMKFFWKEYKKTRGFVPDTLYTKLKYPVARVILGFLLR